jgi:pimeloyl-ACP methyl ester carboxylesterase
MQLIQLKNAGLWLEYAWFYPPMREQTQTPIVLLHEGLGCMAMWKDFPQALSDATGCAVVAYSRQGYGTSIGLKDVDAREVDFMHQEAEQVLPEFLTELNIVRPILVGHSDGASIALLAAAHAQAIAAVVVMAPHLFVEEIAISAIAATRKAYADPTSGLKTRLAKFHQEVDHAFYGWADIWLKPAFATWNIEEAMKAIICPVLAIQGEQDQYGTMNQIDQLKVLVPHAQLLKLPQCRHSPQFDQPLSVVQAISAFVTALRQSTDAK